MPKTINQDILNQKQLHILKLLYKFRFLTAPLLCEYRNQKSTTPITRALKLLETKGYVIRRYKKSYKLAGKPAGYALAPKALTYLRDNLKLNEAVLHSYYKNKSVSDEFIEHHKAVVECFLILWRKDPDNLRLFSKYELHAHDDLPERKPDLYAVRKTTIANRPTCVLIYVYEDDQLFVIKKHLKQVFEFYETEDSDNCGLMIICKNGAQERALLDHIEKLRDGYDVSLKTQVVTLKAFLHS